MRMGRFGPGLFKDPSLAFADEGERGVFIVDGGEGGFSAFLGVGGGICGEILRALLQCVAQLDKQGSAFSPAAKAFGGLFKPVRGFKLLDYLGGGEVAEERFVFTGFEQLDRTGDARGEVLGHLGHGNIRGGGGPFRRLSIALRCCLRGVRGVGGCCCVGRG